MYDHHNDDDDDLMMPCMVWLSTHILHIIEISTPYVFDPFLYWFDCDRDAIIIVGQTIDCGLPMLLFGFQF